ncbi:hypothetical protein [Paracoccus sp. KR1-242]|uniref:hypothetical protein n=1 Tax=Paracoccus sp. KR1-242 TaxID=3410028 RepID=UPI003C06AC92
MPAEIPTNKPSAAERLLATIKMIDASQACALLRIETHVPERIIQDIARDCAVITVIQNGETVLPLFQFNTASGTVFEVVLDLLRLRPARISNLRLCYWLTRAHVDFGCAPADRFGRDDAAILDAFRRYIEPELQG